MAGPLNGRTGEVMRWCIGLAVAALVSYFTAQGTTNQRLTKVETEGAERWYYVQSSLTRIEGRLERRDQEMQQIISDWLNGIDRRTGEPLPLQRAIQP
jgi:hypothetical protein